MVVATVSRYAWSAAATAAALFLVALALTGGRPGPGFAAFEPRGLMLGIPIEQVREVVVIFQQGRWRFVRSATGAWQASEGAVAAGFETRLETALKLLHNAGPERVLTGAEATAAGSAQFGLNTPDLRVVERAEGATAFAISFGGLNPLGLARYARVDDAAEVALLPAYVTDAWQQVIGAP